MQVPQVQHLNKWTKMILNTSKYKLLVRIGALLIVLIGFLFFDNKAAFAMNNSSYSYSVKVKGQNGSSSIEKTVSPKQRLHVKLLFTNRSSTRQIVNVECNTAFTGDTGNIQYNHTNIKSKFLSNTRFNKLVTGLGTVTLPANSTIKKSYTIKIPNQKFKGVIVGGFYVKQILNNNTTNTTQTSKKRAAMGYKNEIAYAIPIVLNESNKIIHTKLVLKNLSSSVINGNALVLAKIENVTPTVFGQLSVHTKIINLKSKNVVLTSNQSNMSMAPLSQFNYHILLNKNLKYGNYILQISMHSGKRHWKFSKVFSVSRQVANATNTHNHHKNNNSWWVLIIAGVIVVILLVIGAYYLGKRNPSRGG